MNSNVIIEGRRKFDHEHAMALRADGAPVAEIAARFGVSRGFIYRITRTEPTARGRWKRRPLQSRLMAKIDVRGPEECWPWLGNRNQSGYGLIVPNGSETRLRVHRVVYELFVGEIPEGHDIDHVCHNADLICPGGTTCLHRRCCNPAHLEPATRGENVRRGNINRRRRLGR